MGGGEHLKADMEDLLQLVPGGGRVMLTTCYGLCNHSPNMKLKSSRGGTTLMQARGRGRLRNDGGLRMRVDDDDAHENEVEEASDNMVTISDITIPKVARAVGLKRPHAIRAIESKSVGNKFLRDGRYKDALHQFTLGRYFVSSQEEERDDIDWRRSMTTLQASLWLCCTKTRTQWASELDDVRGKDDMLQLAAGDAFRVLSATSTHSARCDCIDVDVDAEGAAAEATDTIEAIIAKLVRSYAGLETQAIIMARNEIVGDDDRDIPVVPTTTDVKTLTQLCVALADSWSGLAIVSMGKQGAIFADGALIAYTCVLMATPAKARIFRAKERRRIEKAIAVLSRHGD
jgi:hypothetical protein